MARCPAHDDRKQSLAVSCDRDGRILMKCHAGCKTEDVVAALGLKMSDLFPPKQSSRSSKREAEYIYRDPDGTPILKKIKLRNSDGSKSFFWQRHDGKLWISNRNGVGPMLYGLESLKGDTVAFIVEGEKDADTLHRFGWPAVSLPDGAGSAWHDEYGKALAGLSVYIVPDNDGPGHQYAKAVAENLVGIAKAVYLLDLTAVWPAMPEKADITDYVEAVGIEQAVKAVSDLAQQATPWRPAQAAQYTARKAADFGEDNTTFVWFPYVPVGEYTVLMSPGGTGKTYLICGIAAAISKGEALPGDDPPDAPGTVLIISAEDRGELLKRRLSASGANLDNVLILDCQASEGLNFTEGYEQFKALIKRYSPRLVVVDPWHGFLGESIDINRVNAVRPVFQRLANIAKECGCGMILISHVNKRAQGENINNAATGSTDFVNASRSALYLIFDEEDIDRRIVVHTKSNYARYGESVCFRVEDGGLRWDGFSDVDRSTMEKAARLRKTPGEVVQAQEARDTCNQNLLTALLDSANPFEVVRFVYDEFKNKYGTNIFGPLQPKRALDAVAGEMSAQGYELRAGIQVRGEQNIGKGFSISPLVN